MSYCKLHKEECIYTDRDNDNKCSLESCKFRIKLQKTKDGSFKTKYIKTNSKKFNIN